MKAIVVFCGVIAVVAAGGDYHSYQQHEVQHHQKHIPIIKSDSQRAHDGSYQYNYETANGIQAHEQGYVKNQGSKDHETQVAEGYYSYTGDDGVKVSLHYVADENGFRAEGSHLPVPPPIPHEIQEALAKIASQPQHHGDDEYEQYQGQQQHYKKY